MGCKKIKEKLWTRKKSLSVFFLCSSAYLDKMIILLCLNDRILSCNNGVKPLQCLISEIGKWKHPICGHRWPHMGCFHFPISEMRHCRGLTPLLQERILSFRQSKIIILSKYAEEHRKKTDKLFFLVHNFSLIFLHPICDHFFSKNPYLPHVFEISCIPYVSTKFFW